MVEQLGSDPGEVVVQVKKTKGAHCRFNYLRRIFEDRMLEQLALETGYGVTQEVRRLRDQAVRIYLLYLGEISLRFQHALDHALTPEQLGQRTVHGVEAADRYIEWFYLHSHPRMILPDIPVPVPMPPEREVLDARAAQEDEDVGYLQLSGRMSRIRDHVYAMMSNGVVP